MKDRIKKYLKKDSEVFANNRDAIHQTNVKMFTVLFGITLFCYTFCFIASFILPSYLNMRYFYLGMLVCIVLCFVLCTIFKLISRFTFPFYLIYSVIIISATYTSSYITPDYCCVIILLCLLEMPLFLLDRKLPLVVFEICAAAYYLLLALPHKNIAIRPDEVVNVIIFAAVGILTGLYFRRVRLDNLDLARRQDIEKSTDHTTGLLNRRKLYEYLAECEKGDRVMPYAVAMIDIDSFKTFSDNYGHIAGDDCLETIGKAFALFGKLNDMDFFRFGGEEFVAIVHKPLSNTLAERFTELNRAVMALKIPHEGQPSGYLTVSVGVAEVNTAHTVNEMESVIIHADQALYTAKAQGKNKTILFMG